MQDILTVKNIRKTFGGIVAVKDVSFTVEANSRVGIIGPNGAGKTTLFNVISGKYKATSGTVEFLNERISGRKPHQICKRGIARTFQITQAFENLSVYEHVLVGATLKKLSFTTGVEQQRKVSSLLELIGLQRLKDVVVKNLTTALKKQVELVTALATEPKLLLLDEFMAGLTFVEIDKMLRFLRKINEEMGITLVVVEHVMKAIMELCGKIVVIHNGEKIAEGTPHEVVSNRVVIEAYLGEESKHA